MLLQTVTACIRNPASTGITSPGNPSMKTLRALAICLCTAPLAMHPALWAADGPLSELTIRNTAIEKMLMDELFIDEGRYPLLPPTACQYAYVDSPAVTLAGGRVRIRVRLSGKLSMEVGDQCLGTRADVVQIALSARPAFAGEALVLTDIRIDEISNEGYRVLLQQFLASAIPRAVKIDVRAGLQRILSDRQSTYEVEVSRLSVTALTAEDNQLRAKLSFGLTAR